MQHGSPQHVLVYKFSIDVGIEGGEGYIAWGLSCPPLESQVPH